jgi:hypothetical protein
MVSSDSSHVIVQQRPFMLFERRVTSEWLGKNMCMREVTVQYSNQRYGHSEQLQYAQYSRDL